VLHSYGLAIIVFTILVRAALTPLTLRQLRSAKRIAALAPRLKQLQQRYKGNREGLVRAQMALYKEMGANPAAGCLPLLLQMPILYALFFVFQDLAHPHTTALYHQPFLWFRLDQPDHLLGAFGPLPLLAGLTQWVHSRMMVQPTSDPQQRLTQQLMQVLPLMIIVFAVNYPAGLALYWVVTTLCSIVLQYFVTGWGALFSSPLHVPEALPQNGAAVGPHVSFRIGRWRSACYVVEDDAHACHLASPGERGGAHQPENGRRDGARCGDAHTLPDGAPGRTEMMGG
jgi:YidC/Oxa1 family membrane protein insertase